MSRLAVVACAAAAVALLGGGFLAGWWGRASFGSTDTNVTVVRPLTVERAAGVAASEMPNVLGLERDAARQALADAGIDLRHVTIGERAYAGQAGIVIEQKPDAASALPKQAKLTVAVRGHLPKLTGLAVDDARSKLSALGATVKVQSEYQPGVAEGTVLATQPTAGAPLVERVQLIVAEPLSSVFVDQLTALDSSCGSDDVYVGGVEHKESLVCQPGEGSPATAEYVLNRGLSRFQAVLGLADGGATDVPVRFRIFVDGRVRATRVVAYGHELPVAVDTVGALRLRLETSLVGTSASGGEAQAVFGDAKLVGGRSAVDRLVAESHS